MTLRHKLISHYLPHHELYDIIPHHGIVYLRTCGIYGAILALLTVSYRGITSYVQHESIGTMRMILGVLTYWFFLVDIADKYLDGLIVTNMWLVHFTRDHLFKQTSTNLQRVSIETVSDARDSLRDKLFNKGDITLAVEDKEYAFRDISAPADQVAKILFWKEKIVGKHHYAENVQPEEAQPDPQKELKNEILIEALSEVILEYIDKKK